MRKAFALLAFLVFVMLFQNFDSVPSLLSLSFGGICQVGDVCTYSGSNIDFKTVWMGCSSGYNLSIDSAIYGLGPASEACVNYVQAQCNGQNSCIVAFEPTNCGGDPDPGVAKSASVTAVCLAPPPSTIINAVNSFPPCPANSTCQYSSNFPNSDIYIPMSCVEGSMTVQNSRYGGTSFISCNNYLNQLCNGQTVCDPLIGSGACDASAPSPGMSLLVTVSCSDVALPSAPFLSQVIYSQLSHPVTGANGTVFTASPGGSGAGEDGFVAQGLKVVEWDKDYLYETTALPASRQLNQSISWTVGDFTGFYPTGSGTQVGFPGSAYGATAVQAQGATIGVLINSASLLNPQGYWPVAPMPIIPSLYFANQTPFAIAGTTLQASFDLQVPYATTVNNTSIGQIVAYFSFVELTSGRTIAYGASIWDSRGTRYTTDSGYLGLDSCGAGVGCTNSLIVQGPISGGLYNTQYAGSSNFQPLTWSGFRHFVYAISSANLTSAIQALNSTFLASEPLSLNLSNYMVNGLSIDSEIEYNNSPATFAYSVRNIIVGTTSSSASPTMLGFGQVCPAGVHCSYSQTKVDFIPLTMSCGAEKNITVAGAQYGLGTNIESCSVYAQSTCNGFNTCQVTFDPTVCGGDPAPGVQKSGFVDVYCN